MRDRPSAPGKSSTERRIAPATPFKTPPDAKENAMGKYALLWLLGIPLPVLVVAYLIFH